MLVWIFVVRNREVTSTANIREGSNIAQLVHQVVLSFRIVNN